MKPLTGYYRIQILEISVFVPYESVESMQKCIEFDLSSENENSGHFP